MKVQVDLMTREEMLAESSVNKGNRYTIEEWQKDGDYVVTNRNGYLEYANGEEVIDENDLPEDGWFDCTDYDEDEDSYTESGFYDTRGGTNQPYDNPLYDSDDEW